MGIGNDEVLLVRVIFTAVVAYVVLIVFVGAMLAIAVMAVFIGVVGLWATWLEGGWYWLYLPLLVLLLYLGLVYLYSMVLCHYLTSFVQAKSMTPATPAPSPIRV